jgi:drug/metabolite transporter (DMT)-like permease
LLIALAAVLGGIALVLGDITIPQSTVGGVAFILAGVCWAIAAILARRKRQRPS